MSAGPARAILHPTDFSEQSEVAFAHALRIALESRAKLYIYHVHAGPRDEVPWHEYPSVRRTLERWGFLEPNSPRAAVGKLGIAVEKLFGNHKDVVESVAAFGKRKEIDLLVLATEERRGLGRLKPSIAERLARESRIPALFVRHGARACVDWQDGRVAMRRVLVPVSHRPRARAALARAQSLLELFGSEDSVLTVLHVGDEHDFPLVELPADAACQLERVTRRGDATRRILEHAQSTATDLIVITTAGQAGLVSALRGSMSANMLRRAPCPVLVVPAGVE